MSSKYYEIRGSPWRVSMLETPMGYGRYYVVKIYERMDNFTGTWIHVRGVRWESYRPIGARL